MWKAVKILTLLYFLVITLIAVIGPDLMGRSSDSKVMFVQSQFVTFDSALDMFMGEVGRYPTTREGLQVLAADKPPAENAKGWDGPYLKTDPPTDPWNNPYHYTSPGIHNPKTYDIVSAGADGILGTEDDLANWIDVSMWKKEDVPAISLMNLVLSLFGILEDFLGLPLFCLMLSLWGASGIWLMIVALARFRKSPARKTASVQPSDEKAN